MELKWKYLHNANDSATVIGEVTYASDHIRSVEESRCVGCHQHEQAHGGHRRPGDQPDDGCPQKEEANKTLNRTREVDHPRPSTAAVIRSGGRVEKTGEDAEVAADVLEDGNGVKRGLIIALARFKKGGVDGEGVQEATGALDPYAGCGGDPFVMELIHLIVFRFHGIL